MADGTDLILEADEREKRLFEQLSALPEVEVMGVVDPTGVSCHRSGSQKEWTMVFSFDSWRISQGKLQTVSLTLRRHIKYEEFKKYEKSIISYTVLRVQARVVRESVLGRPQGLLDSIIGPDTSDPELNACARELQKPVTFEDSTFGTFTLDRRINWFETQTEWNGNRINLYLDAEKDSEIQDALTTARSLWQDLGSWTKKIQDYAVNELLELKNETWLAKNEEEITADQFKSRMTLDSITVSPDGDFEFLHNDGDLFYGHAISISGNLEEGPNDADIPG
jgi:hypothetical protein